MSALKSHHTTNPTWYADEKTMNEVTTAVETWTNFVVGSKFGSLQSHLNLLMIQVLRHVRAGCQTTDGAEKQDGQV